MTWAGTAVAISAAGLGMGVADKFGAFGSPGGGGSQSMSLPTMNNSPWDYQNQQLMAQTGQNDILAGNAGQLPPGMQDLLDRLKKQQLLQNQYDTYGPEGRAGGSLMDNAMAAGAMGGVGPRAMMAKTGQVMNDDIMRRQSIRNAIDTYGMGESQRLKTQGLQTLNQMPRSMDLPWTGQIPQQTIPGAPQMDWAGLASGLGGLTGQLKDAGFMTGPGGTFGPSGYGKNTPNGVVDMGSYSKLPTSQYGK